MSTEAREDTYPGFNVILMGPSGTGKTYSIGTLVEAGLDVFYLGLEPGLETLVGYFTDPKPYGKGLPAPPSNLFWHYLQSQSQPISEMIDLAEKIGKFDQSQLAKMRDSNRGKNNPMVPVYTALNSFTDQRTGKIFDPVDNWGTDKVLVIDSLSALARLEMEMAIGNRPVRDKPDYGLAQSNLMSFIHKITSGVRCHVVLLAHVDREVDEIMGGIKLMPHLGIGKAILADLPQPFSDVILTLREGDKFYWDTANSQADLKTRNLPIASRILPDFKQIHSRWKSRHDAAMKG